MYCTCGAKQGYAAAPTLDGGPWDKNYNYWVCAKCGMPSRLSFEGLTHMLTPHRATALLSADGQGDGRTMLTWATSNTGERITTMAFHAYPRKVDMPNDQGREVLLELWKKLDELIDAIREESTDYLIRERNKVEAGMLAKVIALIMSPFYADPTAVLRESMFRWQARQDGVGDHATPGLSEAVWDPATRFDGTPYDSASEAKARTKPTKSEPTLDAQKIAFVKNALENGVMPPETLAGMFNVSVDTIKAALDS